MPGFTQRYNAKKLVFFEIGADVNGVIAREKEIKGWSRVKKEALITLRNPNWKDLYKDILDG